MKAGDVGEGDVVQISPNYDNPRFHGAFAVVTQPHPWGIEGYVNPPPDGSVLYDGIAFVRVKWDHMEYVGRAVWMVGMKEEP